jgi:hypothetical protein
MDEHQLGIRTTGNLYQPQEYVEPIDGGEFMQGRPIYILSNISLILQITCTRYSHGHKRANRSDRYPYRSRYDLTCDFKLTSVNLNYPSS